MACSLQAEDSNRFKTMVAFDCRGVEPVDFSPRVSHYFMHDICDEAQTWQVSRLCRESHNFMANLTLSRVDN